MRYHKLYTKFLKSEFCLESISFLGNTVSKDGILVDPTLIKSIHCLSISASPNKVHSFVGLEGYNSQLIEGFSSKNPYD